jgi:hypothetical protein
MGVGSDICYFEEDYEALLLTLAQLDAAASVIAIQHRNDCHVAFADAARARGWVVEEASVRRELHGHPVEYKYCCTRCSILVLTRPRAAPGCPLLRRTADSAGRTAWAWVGSAVGLRV